MSGDSANESITETDHEAVELLHHLLLRLAVPGQHVGDTRIGRRPPRLVVSNVTEVEAFSWSTVMRGLLSRAV